MVFFVRNKLVIHVVEVFCLPPARYSISTHVYTSYLRDIYFKTMQVKYLLWHTRNEIIVNRIYATQVSLFNIIMYTMKCQEQHYVSFVTWDKTCFWCHLSNPVRYLRTCKYSNFYFKHCVLTFGSVTPIQISVPVDCHVNDSSVSTSS